MKGGHSHITAACLYLARGMPEQARAELDAMTSESPGSWRALVLRVSVHMELGEWEQMREISRRLAAISPHDSKWPLCIAYATRRLESVEQAREVLAAVEADFPGDAGIKYNLACFAAQGGDLASAKII